MIFAVIVTPGQSKSPSHQSSPLASTAIFQRVKIVRVGLACHR
jgi:hypothetical protein